MKSTRFIVPVVMALAMAACAETELAVHTAKRITPESPDQVGRYKVGEPYQVAGKWYYPKEDYSYVETGLASWYGAKFHGQETANGETFDMNAVSAAHRTLPLPSIVRVTNLDNGRSLKVRVNDRGPYARGRIIDLSRRAAELLGFRDAGTAKVRVKLLEKESRVAKRRARSGEPVPESFKAEKAPAPDVKTASLETGGPTDDTAGRITAKATAGGGEVEASVETTTDATNAAAWASSSDGVEKVAVTGPNKLYVQAGAFVDYANARNLKARLSDLGRARVTRKTVGSEKFYRVRLGPVSDVDAADSLLRSVVNAGYDNARLIVD